MELDLNEIILSDRQIESMAYSIYKDIGNYIEEHKTEYFNWDLENYFINIVKNFVGTINGIKEKHSNYKYKLCDY